MREYIEAKKEEKYICIVDIRGWNDKLSILNIRKFTYLRQMLDSEIRPLYLSESSMSPTRTSESARIRKIIAAIIISIASSFVTLKGQFKKDAEETPIIALLNIHNIFDIPIRKLSLNFTFREMHTIQALK